MSLSEEERKIIVNLEYENYNCIYQTTEEEVQPMIEPAIKLIERIGVYIAD